MTMRDWKEYLSRHVDSEFFGFTLLDYYYQREPIEFSAPDRQGVWTADQGTSGIASRVTGDMCSVAR